MKKTLKKIFIIVLTIILFNTFALANVKAESEELSDEELAKILAEEGYTEEEIAKILAGEDIETDEEQAIEEAQEESYEEAQEESYEEAQEQTTTESSKANNTEKENNKDNSQSTEKLAYTGLQNYYLLLILPIVFLIYTGIKYKEYKNIK